MARPVTRTTILGTSGSSSKQRVPTPAVPRGSMQYLRVSAGCRSLAPSAPKPAKALESWNRLRMSPTSSSPCFKQCIMWYRLHRGSLPSRRFTRCELGELPSLCAQGLGGRNRNFRSGAAAGFAQPRIEYIVTLDERDPYRRGCHLAESSNLDIKNEPNRRASVCTEVAYPLVNVLVVET